MRKIIEFELVTKGSNDQLKIYVNDLIKKGFEPHGSLTVLPDRNSKMGFVYFQAMVKFAADQT